MCGIAGIVDLGGTIDLQKGLHDLVEGMHLRGPDHEGIWEHKTFGLGHTRLKIIDLETRSNQPFQISDHEWIVFNGEIYNFKRLKDQLNHLVPSWQTTGDTEVLGKAISILGIEKTLDQIQGMFAFAYINTKTDKLVLARDHFGKKPLYVYRDDKSLVFCSEVRGITGLMRDRLSLNLDSIDYYLHELSMPQPSSIWKEVTQVPAAHYSEYSISTLTGDTKEYWSLPDKTHEMDETEALQTTEELLVKAIQKRTVADRPLGCFLSGGVDSGLVVSLLAQNYSKKLPTFTVGIKGGNPYDEMEAAKKVATRYDTDHHEIMVDPSVCDILPNLVDYCGEPFADSSLIPSYYVCKAIGSNLKVALSGDGGDELFGGYYQYKQAALSDQFYSQPGIMKSTPAVLLDKLMSRVNGKRENAGALREYKTIPGHLKLFRQMGHTLEQRKSLWSSSIVDSTELSAETYLQNIWDTSLGSTQADHIMKASLKTRLVNDYLVKVDRSSMINSLEVRSPFLDLDLANHAFSLQSSSKFTTGHEKYLLKKLAQKHVNPDIFKLEKKGFSIPIHEWIRGEMKGLIGDTLLSENSSLKNYFNTNFIHQLVADHNEHRSNNTHQIWSLLCLNIWFDQNGIT